MALFTIGVTSKNGRLYKFFPSRMVVKNVILASWMVVYPPGWLYKLSYLPPGWLHILQDGCTNCHTCLLYGCILQDGCTNCHTCLLDGCKSSRMVVKTVILTSWMVVSLQDGCTNCHTCLLDGCIPQDGCKTAILASRMVVHYAVFSISYGCTLYTVQYSILYSDTHSTVYCIFLPE